MIKTCSYWLKKNNKIFGNGYLYSAGENLKRDRDLLKEILKMHGCAIKKLDEDLRNDKELVLIAVENDGNPLSYVSDELKNDREVVETAINQDSYSFVYASKELRNDEKIAIKALKNNIKQKNVNVEAKIVVLYIEKWGKN